jgi:hypothetical protein
MKIVLMIILKIKDLAIQVFTVKKIVNILIMNNQKAPPQAKEI